MMTNNLKLCVKELIGKTIDISNLTKTLINDKFYIFSFHEITDSPSIFQKKNKLFVTKKIFKDQINFIKKLFKVINPEELISNKVVKNSALITFDDGYLNSFHYGLDILSRLKITPVFFLNMSAIKNQIPLLPASIEYLELYYKNFNYFIKKHKLSKPVSLSIKPSQFIMLNDYIKFNKNKINKYQGKMVSYNYLKKEHKKKKFFIADHLYEHYNCLALNKVELDSIANKNSRILKNFNNFINIFSFPNGVPNICFNKKNVNWIKKLNYAKAFSNGNTTNSNSKKFLLDRISLNNDDNSFNKFLFKIFRAKNN
tara:strand:- start:141 stop:1079 length:939 start_codon:yes stop_codon:yes gene_type:complete